MTAESRTVRIGSSHGLHARPAKLFAQAAKDAGIPVTIAKDSGKPVNAASILGVIALGVEHGDYVTLTADGENAEAVLDTLAELLTTDHDEESAG
jgi:phosphocarrier protein